MCEIPEDIIKKREKKQARDAKANGEDQPQKELTEEEKQKTQKKAASAAKASKNAKIKKLQKQLEGLDLTEKMIMDLM